MFTLDRVVPWGRSFDEYRHMFALSEIDQLGEAFHVRAVHDLCRVAREVRIFPLLALGSRPSPYVDTIVEAARNSGCDVSIEMVPYEFQRGGNQMMRIRG